MIWSGSKGKERDIQKHVKIDEHAWENNNHGGMVD